jgi:hypothetical protein
MERMNHFAKDLTARKVFARIVVQSTMGKLCAMNAQFI